MTKYPRLSRAEVAAAAAAPADAPWTVKSLSRRPASVDAMGESLMEKYTRWCSNDFCVQG
jgi:hypothetical protein